MDLVTALVAVNSLADLPAVVAALGHEPIWEEIPAETWLTGAAWHRSIERAAVVGRVGRWPWYAVAAAAPATAAVRVGQWLGRRGHQGGVIALDASGRALTFSVSVDPAPSLHVPLDAPDRFALSTLRRAAGSPRPGPLEQTHHVADALANRRVDHAFFAAFRLGRDRLAASLLGPGAADRESLALLQLTRILFLYFVQAKGWLDGRNDFLARSLDECLRHGRHPQRDLLHPLFFGTLNRPVARRNRSTLRFGRIPFLNGGLFEPHPLERRVRAAAPTAVWRQVFDELFERFHFTVAEGDTVGIAPDMLGRVFEGLMSPDARRLTGTFYTPPTLVSRMVDAGLAALLQARLAIPADRAFELLADPDPAVRPLLAAITVLDPAAGSGAFLLGALERLSGAAVRDGRSDSAARSLTLARRAVLRRNLFGVDLSATAVRLAELRLWLAVVRDDPAGPGDEVEPLPNLDCTIRQGDSLRDPLPCRAIAAFDAEPLAKARAAAIDANGPDKRPATDRLRAEERRAACATLSALERELDHGIAECLSDARAPTLFDRHRGLDRELRGRIAVLRSDRATTRGALRRLRRDGEMPWFHYHAHFGDVFAHGGFDLIVGNPPWVRSEAIPPRIRRELVRRYRWWGAAGGAGYSHPADLSIAFVERALELAAPGGAVSFLVPAKLATADYATRARAALAAQHNVRVVSDLSADPDASFGATVYPLALVVTKEPPRPEDRTRVSLAPDGATVPRSSLGSGGPWVMADPSAGSIRAALRERYPVLADAAPPQLGVKTGENRAFIDPPDWIDTSFVRVALRGREVGPFMIRPRHRLLWTHGADGRPAPVLPPDVLAHLAPWRERLEQRADHQAGPWWQLFRVGPAFARHRVVWPDLSRRLTACALTGRPEVIPLNSCYVARMPSAPQAHALAAWLNAAPLRALARLGADPAMSGYARFNARSVGQLPWPEAAATDQALTTFGERGSNREDDTEALDGRAADLLELDARDRRALVAGHAHHRR
ncbi:MAG TPA: hypothetical protein VGR60_08055 [Gemmatimonadales bacterium]|nr:hypothetical protein [Gemmatimonadales bacterium]